MPILRRTLLLASSVLFAAATLAAAQELSQKETVAVFNLDQPTTFVPNNSLVGLNQNIRAVFSDLGRFDVTGYARSLAPADIPAFIDMMRQFRESGTVTQHKVAGTDVSFTDSDLRSLSRDAIAVFPALTHAGGGMDSSGEWLVSLITTFTFVDLNELKTVATLKIGTSGIDKSRGGAVQQAVTNIASRLGYGVRKLAIFRLSTAIVDVQPPHDVTVHFGSDMGIRAGDEFVVESADQDVGLLLVTKSGRWSSSAVALYSDVPLAAGMQLKEFPRFGTDSGIYANALLSSGAINGLFGLRMAVTRGFYRVRPVFDVEVPLSGILAGSAPADLYAGAEILNTYLGRVGITPSIVLGVGSNLYNGKLYLSHVGGKAQISVSYLLGRGIRLSGTAGFMAMEAISPQPAAAWNKTEIGPYAGMSFSYYF